MVVAAKTLLLAQEEAGVAAKADVRAAPLAEMAVALVTAAAPSPPRTRSSSNEKRRTTRKHRAAMTTTSSWHRQQLSDVLRS